MEAASDLGRRSGERLGRFRLGRMLGEGGFGVVYEAVDEASGRPVAVKLLHTHLGDVREVARRFRREAETMYELRHPNVVEVLEAGEASDGALYFVMERLEGEDLAALLERVGPLRVGDAVRIVLQVLEALAVVHESGIVHRDLKPDNVFLVAREGPVPLVKLLDFGVAKIVGGGQVSMATRTGTTVGTAYYMSPEQAQAKKDVDHRADLYAVGVLLFRMLAGAHPFEDESYPLLVVKICMEPAPLLSTFRGDVPGELARLVEALLAKEPEERPANARVVRDRLAAFVDVLETPVLRDGHGASRVPRALRIESPLAHADTQLSLDEPARAAPSRLRRWAPAAAVALALAVGVGVYASRRATEPTAPRAVSTLPRPAPPEVREAFDPSATRDDYVFANPRPRAFPTFYDVAVGGPGTAALVGREGRAFVLRKGTFMSFDLGTSAVFHGVAWVGEEDLLAVGTGGTIVLLAGNEVVPLAAPTTETLRDVLVLSPGEWLVVGDAGTFLRVVDRRVSRIELADDEDVLSIARDGAGAVLAGTGGYVARWTREGVRREASGTNVALRAVAVCEGGTYVAGDDGAIFAKPNDGGGRFARVGNRSRETVHDLVCRGTQVLGAGGVGGIVVIEGLSAVRLDGGSDRPFYAIDATASAAVMAVGQSGQLAGVGPDRVIQFTRGSTKTLLSMASVSGALVAVGVDGTVLREEDGGFSPLPCPIASGIASVAAVDADHAIAVGDLGAVLSVSYGAVRSLPSPTTENLRALLVGEGGLLVVGENGVVLRGPVEALVASRLTDGAHLRALAGTPDSALGVGERGAVYAFDARGETRIECGVQETLRAVAREGGVYYAVGDGGVFVRIEGSACSVERRAGKALYAIGPGPSGGLLAVGDDGVAVTRAEDGTLAESLLDTGGYDLRAVHATSREVVVAGAGGVILRRARLGIPSGP